MSNVQFEDQRHTYTVTRRKGLPGLMIKWGLAKDEKSAQVVLLIIAVLAIAIGGFFLFTGNAPGDGQQDVLPPGQFIPE